LYNSGASDESAGNIFKRFTPMGIVADIITIVIAALIGC